MAVILEAVDAALRIFLYVSALYRVAVVVRVLLAFAVAAAVVCRVPVVVHAALAVRRPFVIRVAGRGQFPALGDQAMRSDA
jgi:hypothetical protein